MMPDLGLAITFLVLLGVASAIYFLPTIIAAARDRQDVLSVAMINPFFGWSVIGWLVCLFWACNARTQDEAEAR